MFYVQPDTAIRLNPNLIDAAQYADKFCGFHFSARSSRCLPCCIVVLVFWCGIDAFDWVIVDFADRELRFDICYNVCWRHRIKRFDVCQYIFQSIFLSGFDRFPVSAEALCSIDLAWNEAVGRSTFGFADACFLIVAKKKSRGVWLVTWFKIGEMLILIVS